MIKLDEFDLKIINCFFQLNNATTTDIAKKIFNVKDAYHLRLKDNFIRNRLLKLESIGLIQSDVLNGSTIYTIDETKCKKLKGNLILKNRKQNLKLLSGDIIILKNDKFLLLVSEISS